MPVVPMNPDATGSSIPDTATPAVVMLAPAFGCEGDVRPQADGLRVARRSLEPVPWEVDLLRWLSPAVVRTGLVAADAGISAGKLPAAHLLYAIDRASGAVPDVPVEHVVLAEPVGLTPGRDEATLLPREALALTAAEVSALFASTNDWLREDGQALVQASSGRSYLIGLDGSALETPPAHALARRHVGKHFPASADTAIWRRLMTEIQMHWHTHAVNERREAEGLPLVNAIWFSGGSRPRAVAPRSPSKAVLAVDELARALSRQQGATVLPRDARRDALPEAAADTASDARHDARRDAGRVDISDAVPAPDDVTALLAAVDADTLVIVDLSVHSAWLAGDFERCEEARARLVTEWIDPLLAAVIHGKACSVTLSTGDGQEVRWSPGEASDWAARLRRRLVRVAEGLRGR